MVIAPPGQLFFMSRMEIVYKAVASRWFETTISDSYWNLPVNFQMLVTLTLKVNECHVIKNVFLYFIG